MESFYEHLDVIYLPRQYMSGLAHRSIIRVKIEMNRMIFTNLFMEEIEMIRGG